MDDDSDVFNCDLGERWQTDTKWKVDESRRRSVGGRIANVGDLAIEECIELIEIYLNDRTGSRL